jgi:hypothetical protein
MKPLRILSHGPSESLNDLIASLREAGVEDIKKIKKVGSTYRGSEDHFIFNWGTCSPRVIIRGDIFNKPSAVSIARNKLETFKSLSRYGRPIGTLWTDDRAIAKRYIQHGCKVYCRTDLTGSQGSGIVVVSSVDELIDAPLYTVQAPICYEYRAHVFDCNCILVAQKKRMNQETLEEREIQQDLEVRNLENGWIFSVINDPIGNLLMFAEDIVGAIDLNFGAVDFGMDHLGNFYFFEVNTAPGLEGTTLMAYRDAILRKLVNSEELLS